MTETVEVEVDSGLAKRFRKKAKEKHGYRKGAVKMALVEAMRRYAGDTRADWGSLIGGLNVDKDSVWLQRHAWK